MMQKLSMRRKTTYRYLWVLCALVFVGLTAQACLIPGSAKTTTSAGGGAANAHPDLSSQMAVDKNGYPKAPEGVVRLFLTAYTLDPKQMNVYLSDNRLSNMPPGGALEMLKLNGTMEGFVIESASVSPSTGAAEVVVSVRSGGKDDSRTFKLLSANGKWAIDAIDLK
jgi:hypothetical protein